METSVWETLASRRLTGAGNGSVCWCPLCTADMQALALTSLPPQYVTRREDRAAIDAAHQEAVREQVERALHWVTAHPKHRPGTADSPARQVSLVNFTYEIGFALVDERATGLAGCCECFECRCDAVAFALNRFPPRYGVAVDGRSPFSDDHRVELGADLVPFLDHGLRIVANLPRHSTDH